MPPPAKPTAKKATEPQAKQSASKPLTAPQKALRKLGLNRAIDLALHLPLRYEDETRIVRLSDPAKAMWHKLKLPLYLAKWLTNLVGNCWW